MPAPLVSVVMSVYNGERYLAEAIESILNQTFRDFEFIIIDDGSTDGTATILDGFHDPRIVRWKNEQNIGLTRSLNKGLEMARGEYIARMDADDISLPERLQQQVHFLDEHPDIDILGTGIRLIDTRGQPFEELKPLSIPTSPGLMRWFLFFTCCINHPTVMIRRSVLQVLGCYSEAYRHAEDYELWLRSPLTTRLANLSAVLLRLRKHETNVTTIYQETQKAHSTAAVKKAIVVAIQRPVSIDVVRALRDQTATVNPEVRLSVANVLKAVYRAVLASMSMTKTERMTIRSDLVRRLLFQARAVGTTHMMVATRILATALEIAPCRTVRALLRATCRRLVARSRHEEAVN